MGVVGSAESGVSPVIAEVRSQTGLLIVKSDTETNGRKRGEWRNEMIADCDSPVLNKPSITVSSSTFSASLLDELSVTIGSGFTPFGAVAERSDTNGPESSSSSLIEIALALDATAGTAGWIDDNEVAPEAFDIYKPRRVSATIA